MATRRPPTKEKLEGRIKNGVSRYVREGAENAGRRIAGVPLTEDEIAERNYTRKRRMSGAGQESMNRLADSLREGMRNRQGGRVSDRKGDRMERIGWQAENGLANSGAEPGRRVRGYDYTAEQRRDMARNMAQQTAARNGRGFTDEPYRTSERKQQDAKNQRAKLKLRNDLAKALKKK